MRTFKLFNFNMRSSAMVQADGCTAARQKIGVNPRTTSTIGRFASVLCLILTMLFTLGVGEVGATVTIYAVGNMQDNGGTWRDEKTKLNCHNWGSSGTTWPGTSMTKWNDVSVDGHQVWTCNLNADANTNIIFNNGTWQTADKTINATQKAYPYPTYLNGDWVYSPRVAKCLWESDQHAYGGRVYFDNSSANWSETNMYFVIGHATYVGYYKISQIAHTKLFYVDLGSQSWGDSKYVAVVGHGSTKSTGSGNPNNLAALNKFSDVLQYSLEYQSTYLISMSSGTNCTPIEMEYKSDGYSAFNYSQTVKKYTSTDGGSTYSEASINSGTVTITPYKLTNDGTVSNSSNTGTLDEASETSVSKNAVYTGEVALTASANTGYDFVGWFDVASGGSALSTNTSYTYNAPNSTKTIYARFKKKQYTVSYGVNSSTRYGSITLNSGSAVTTTSSSTLNHGTSISFTASANSGYQVEGWYSTSACAVGDRLQEGGTSYNAGTLTAAKTVYVKFKVRTGGTITLSAGANGEVSADNSSWGTTKTISNITTATDKNIYARGNTGYQFSSWTKSSGSGTIKTNAASGVFTTVAYEDATVTASFSEIMRTITISGGVVYGGSETSTTAGVATSAKITANAPAAGKKFTGWTLGSGVSLKAGSSLTDRTIEIYSTANATVTANYADRASVKMYFAKPSGWSKVHAHAWGGSDPSTTWPGIEITGTTETINHVVYNVFLYYTEADGIGNAATGSAGWTSVLFSDDGADSKKTGDLTISNGHYYVKSSTGTGKVAALTSAWCIKGDWNSWNEDTDQITHSTAAAGSKSITLTTGNKEFKIYNIVNETWWRFSENVTATKAATTMNNNSGNMTITPSVAGSYTFTLGGLTSTPTLAITYPTSYTLTYNIGTVKGNDGSISTSPTTASGSKVLSGTDITLTAPAPKAGYSWKGWFTNAAGTTGHIEDEGRAITVTMNANKTLYACYTENDYTVTVAATAGGTITTPASPATTVTAHPATTAAIVAEEAEGYYFENWTTEDDGITIANANNKSTTITATADGTVTANFAELDKIYFRNVFDDGSMVTNWSDVYVYLGITWNEEDQAITNATHDDWRIHMTNIKGTDVWWAYVPRNFTNAAAGTKEKVGFAAKEMNGRSWTFWDTKAATRGDYNRLLNMFVPFHTAKTTGNNGVDYFDNGYWMKYDTKASQGAGYYLKKFKSKGSYDQEGEFIATNDDATFIQFKLRIDESNTTKYYMLTSAGGLNYVADAGITSANCTNVGVSENTNDPASKEVKFSLTTTSEGEYTFILNQSGDKMKLSVIYPVSVGDYRLKHTYNSGSKTTYSDVIKSGDAAEGQTLSMYLSTEGSRSLVLQKCTAIVAGSPRWNAGDATNLSGVLSTVSTNGSGVYQFDVKVSADKVASPAPTATKYTGSYYIKTDGGVGGWANYKQNVMDENTLNYDTDHPEKSFNYYYCKYYGDPGTNLKCVIANDYCNALTDTLVGDAVIGIGNQTTPSAASVRFSYNTYTNEIKRSYLGSSVNSDFLRILGNTAASKPHIYDKAETTYDDSHADSYITFEDKQNWRYEIDVKADVNARAKLTATFNGQTQYFWGHAGESGHEWDNENTEELFGGESGTYGLTLVYDFKTNKLITAWKPTGATISSDLTLNSDILLLREHQGAPTTITFGQKGGSGDYASLSGVKTVYAVLRLNRWRLSNRANPTDLRSDHCSSAELINTWHPALTPGTSGYLSQHERELYFISFPFDVKMSDIIDFGGYYDKWGIMYYDGKGRAKNGYWIDSDSNWKYFTPEEFATKTLKAYEGYLIGIDLAAMAYNNTSFWTNNSCEVDIYFPSKTDVSSITQKAVDVDIDQTGYLCTINRDFGGDDGDRRIKDSYWHCIGVPSYANLSHDINNGAPSDASWANKSLLYLYEWNTETNEHSIMKASSFSFQAMYAYLVQYAGTTLSWAASATGPLPIAARRMKTEELRDRQFNLQLMQGDKEADHTYIRLSDDEEVTTGFEFNHDVSKMMLNGANIYTLIGTEQAAANSLPLNLEQTTVVPVGVKIATTGDYTFSIPEGTEGVGVTLIDNETGARTSLSALDYAIYLEAGTYNERFLLEISPIKLTPTSVDAVTGDGSQITDARKVMIDGLLYIIKDGVIYDARGAMVK